MSHHGGASANSVMTSASSYDTTSQNVLVPPPVNVSDILVGGLRRSSDPFGGLRLLGGEELDPIAGLGAEGGRGRRDRADHAREHPGASGDLAHSLADAVDLAEGRLEPGRARSGADPDEFPLKSRRERASTVSSLGTRQGPRPRRCDCAAPGGLLPLPRRTRRLGGPDPRSPSRDAPSGGHLSVAASWSGSSAAAGVIAGALDHPYRERMWSLVGVVVEVLAVYWGRGGRTTEAAFLVG